MNYKKTDEVSYAVGVFPTIELIRARPQDLRRVYVSSKGYKNRGLKEITESCGRLHIPIEESDGRLRNLSNSDNCYAAGEFKKYLSDIKRNVDHVLLDNPSDMGNLGTIIRTMLGFGVTNLAVIKPGVDIFDPKVIRSSLGAIFRINFSYYNSLAEYQKSNKNLLYSFMVDGKNELPKVKFKNPATLVFGNEGSGLGAEYQSLGETVLIPQSPAVDSLNLAISVGVALYARMTNHV
ncbi:MAG: TrmH family RNA methyltransferase [candidate division WWE3 bacterium]|nr:TrmH family RNA methyltransferase [candidate division WWE3 bacterium]